MYDAGWDVLTLARTPFSAIYPRAEGIIYHVETDLSDEVSIRSAAPAVRDRSGVRGLDARVNNAGISPEADNGVRLTAMQTGEDAFRHVQMVNLIAPLILMRELPAPLAKAGGSVVNVSFIAATRVHPFAGAAYAVSKAGLSALTRELADERAPQGVRVNAVAPGQIDTSILSPGADAPSCSAMCPWAAWVIHRRSQTSSSSLRRGVHPTSMGQRSR